jgi:hypothetical protein
MVNTMGKVMEKRWKWWNTWEKKNEHAGICVYSTINNLG